MVGVLQLAEGKPYDVEVLARRATLDVIGRTGFGHEFRAVEMARLEASRQDGGQGSSTSGSGSGGGEIGDSYVHVIKMLDAILTPAMFLAFDFPVPESWLPGIELGSYSPLPQLPGPLLRRRVPPLCRFSSARALWPLVRSN